MNQVWLVYKHTFPNGKVYIGITSRSATARWGPKGNGYNPQPLMRAAITKHGWDNIKHEIVCTDLTLAEANLVEVTLIKEHSSNQREYGYNLEAGGCNKTSVAEETCLKLSVANRGRKRTDAMVQAMRERATGVAHSEESKCKASKTLSRPIRQYTKTGSLITVFPSRNMAAHHTGICKSSISKCANGQLHAAGDYIWRWAEGGDSY